jgi:hypothetical protein
LLLRVVRFSTGAGFGALTVLRDKQNESPYCLTGQCVPPVDQDEKLPPEA